MYFQKNDKQNTYIAGGETKHGSYRVEWDIYGKLISEQFRPHSQGLGDTFAKATSLLGIKPCGGCKKRQEKLNRLLPYKKASSDSKI